MRSEIAARVERAIEERVFPGCVVGIVKKNREREILPFGRFTYGLDSPQVREDTIYDVASITKSIPTASLALMLVAEGKLRLADSVREYLPELKNDYDATIEDLLMYRVFGTRLSTLKNEMPAQILEYAFAHGFDSPPSRGRSPLRRGEGPPGKSMYTNLPALLLGIIIERIAGDTLDKLAQKYFFGPLEMSHTTFFPISGLRKSRHVAPTEIESGQALRGIVQDESARVFAKAGKAVGYAGLFSTAPDILNFLESLLRGELKSVADGAQEGWGWQIAGDFLGPRAPGRFGKTGFTGTSCVVDIGRPGRAGGIGFVILSNRTYPKRPENGDVINSFRADISDIFLASAV